MKQLFLAIGAAITLLTACKSPETKDEPAAPATEAPAPSPQMADAVPVTLSGGDDMKFDISEIKVKEGQQVQLTLRHTGKAPRAAMGHNFVLLAAGTSFDHFVSEAINARDNDYIPASLQNSVLAHTKTIGGGESDTITFTAPPKGSYDFLCSFPGHAALMKGKFIVE